MRDIAYQAGADNNPGQSEYWNGSPQLMHIRGCGVPDRQVPAAWARGYN